LFCQPTRDKLYCVAEGTPEQEAPVTAVVVGKFKPARVQLQISVSSGIHCPMAVGSTSTSKGASFFDPFWVLDCFLGPV